MSTPIENSVIFETLSNWRWAILGSNPEWKQPIRQSSKSYFHWCPLTFTFDL